MLAVQVVGIVNIHCLSFACANSQNKSFVMNHARRLCMRQPFLFQRTDFKIILGPDRFIQGINVLPIEVLRMQHKSVCIREAPL
jgi:hypothetical protein